MTEIEAKRLPSDLGHHLRQGDTWLAMSAEGQNTAMLTYAAFEFRLGIERIAVSYWSTLLQRKVEADDFRDIRSFKKLEKRIYELAGHQMEIDRHFDLVRILLAALGIDDVIETPKIGQLSSFWHYCSELCHVGWSLSVGSHDAHKATFETLSDMSLTLWRFIRSLGWPIVKDPEFSNLRDRFVTGNACADDVVEFVQRRGLHARKTFNDGREAEPYGETIAASSDVRT